MIKTYNVVVEGEPDMYTVAFDFANPDVAQKECDCWRELGYDAKVVCAQDYEDDD